MKINVNNLLNIVTLIIIDNVSIASMSKISNGLDIGKFRWSIYVTITRYKQSFKKRQV